jgi:hypothetical protein
MDQKRRETLRQSGGHEQQPTPVERCEKSDQR